MKVYPSIDIECRCFEYWINKWIDPEQTTSHTYLAGVLGQYLALCRQVNACRAWGHCEHLERRPGHCSVSGEEAGASSLHTKESTAHLSEQSVSQPVDRSVKVSQSVGRAFSHAACRSVTQIACRCVTHNACRCVTMDCL